MPINKDDFLQPSDPRFEKVYGYNPIREAKEEKRKKENMKQDREDKIKYNARHHIGGLRGYDAKDIIKLARERDLE
jgi:hypothetical protein